MEKQDAQQAYELMRAALNERQWRFYLALEAKKIGRGGISQVSAASSSTCGLIRRGIAEVDRGECYVAGDRIRVPGGGRKSRSSQDPTLAPDLEGLLEAHGDPMRLLQWTNKSVRHLHQALRAQEHTFTRSHVGGGDHSAKAWYNERVAYG